MAKLRPYTLTVAGFDPSGGAGVLADIKTFEQFRCQGLAVATCNTVQVEDHFYSVNPMDQELVMTQLKALLERYPVKWAKVGMVPGLDILLAILTELTSHGVKVVLDPILATSTGVGINSPENRRELMDCLTMADIVTPNLPEAKAIWGEEDLEGKLMEFSKSHSAVLLKGGHDESKKGRDVLFSDGKLYPFSAKEEAQDKHGSGCILSSALSANLALGYPIIKAVLKSRDYTHHCLSSNASLLAYHKK